MNLDLLIKTITTTITVAVLYSFIAFYEDMQHFGFVQIGIYAALAALGSLSAIAFGLTCNRLFAKNQFITSLVSTIAVVFIANQTGLFGNVAMGELCIAITFLIVASDVAASKNNNVEKSL